MNKLKEVKLIWSDGELSMTREEFYNSMIDFYLTLSLNPIKDPEDLFAERFEGKEE